MERSGEGNNAGFVSGRGWAGLESYAVVVTPTVEASTERAFASPAATKPDVNVWLVLMALALGVESQTSRARRAGLPDHHFLLEKCIEIERVDQQLRDPSFTDQVVTCFPDEWQENVRAGNFQNHGQFIVLSGDFE